MHLESVSLIVFTFGVLLTSFLAIAKRKDIVSVWFVIFSLFVAGWGFAESAWMSGLVTYEAASVLTRACNASAIFIPIAWFAFVFSLLRKREPFKGFYMINFIVAGALSLTAPSSLFVSDPKPIGKWAYYSMPGPLYIIFVLIFFTYVPYVFIYLVKAIRQSEGARKKQLLCVFFATILGFGGGGSTFFPVYGFDVSLVTMHLMPAYPFLMGLALIKYGLFSDQDIAHAAHKDKLATIGTLATSVNHEIKNPLYVIKGLTESFKQNYNDGVYADNEDMMKQAYEIMQKAETQTERALEIMRNFSGFAKQGVSEQPSFKTVNLSDVIEKIIPLVSYELKLDQISIKNDISETSIYVKADERYLEEILFNLIMNSCQAMKQTGGELTLSAKEVNDKVLIEIKDNGPGITKEAQKQIFEPFYTTKEEGTGLGLYITKQLVEKIGGKITIDSKEGQGATFRLELNKV